MHLTNAYRKLDITKRAQLAGALGRPTNNPGAQPFTAAGGHRADQWRGA
jgi:hypothetical protein